MGSKRVKCRVDEVELDNDDGYQIDSVRVTCSRCGQDTESYGTSPNSVRRCLVLLRKDCPRGEENYYVDEGE